MQMITLHPEQHIRHRNQRQCHKQVNPTPSHKQKPTIHKILINATADHPPPRYLSMKIHVLLHRPHSKAHCSNALTNHTKPTSPLILPHHHLKSLRIHQTPLPATIRRQPLDKLRRPRMRINAPVHRKRLHLRIHTLLADLHITIRIERHHRTVDLPLRTRRHLHIPAPLTQLPPPKQKAPQTTRTSKRPSRRLRSMPMQTSHLQDTCQ